MKDKYKVVVRKEKEVVLEFMVVDGKVDDSILELHRKLRDEGCEVEITEYNFMGLSRRRDE